MKINTDDNSYTAVYTSVMVVIVTFLPVFVNFSPKATQDKSVQLNTKKQIPVVSNIKNIEGVDAEYQKYVEDDMLMNIDGALTENTGEFTTNYEKEVKEHQRLHVFVCDVDGQTRYVVPICGAGLWGGVWKYVALNKGKDTAYGVYFSYTSETPGLGVEIATDWFQHEFAGKETLEDGAVALGVVKNSKVEEADCQVDDISGGTITSIGVDAMLKVCLNNYISFLTK